MNTNFFWPFLFLDFEEDEDAVLSMAELHGVVEVSIKRWFFDEGQSGGGKELFFFLSISNGIKI